MLGPLTDDDMSPLLTPNLVPAWSARGIQGKEKKIRWWCPVAMSWYTLVTIKGFEAGVCFFSSKSHSHGDCSCFNELGYSTGLILGTREVQTLSTLFHFPSRFT